MPDESHPSLAGSYAAACAFYTMMFVRDPDSITYEAGLGMKTAGIIRSAVHEVVYDSLWKWQRPDPYALPSERQGFEINVSPNPTHDEVTLHMSQEAMADTFLCGTDGRILWNKKTYGTNRLSLEGLPSGIYLLKVITRQGIVVERIVKQ